MPEPSQYTVSHRELVEMIIKSAGIHEGHWMLLVNFQFTAANMGLTGPADALPSGLVQLASVGLQKAAPDAPPLLVVNAAEVNPAAPKKKG